MSKMKTHSSAKKRFKVTAKGRVKSKSAFTRHMMMNKPKSMKRKARGLEVMAEPDQKIVLRNFLPYLRKKKNSKPYDKSAKGAK
ncbi:MAG: 50S ribosomal protein L35 [Alphaproteobacteria bacterium]|nr:50S ribosomal protein L35 [Alphaproteobacteria bacterium]